MITLKQYLDAPDGVISVVKTAIYSAFIFLGIDANVAGILFLLMMIDTFVGVIKVFTLGKKFTFRRLIWGIVTKISVLTIPLTVALMAKGVNIDLTNFVVVVMDVLIVAESFSILTNMLSIKSREDIENRDFITILIKKIRDALGKVIDRLLGNIEPDK